MENELTPYPSDEPKTTTKGNADVRTLIGLTILICLMLLYTQVCSAQANTVKTVQNGEWNTGSTWSSNTPPKVGENVQIVDGHKITLTGTASCANLDLIPPVNSSKIDEKSELVLESGATLTTGTLTLNSKNERRYASLINMGATVTAAALTIGRGSILNNNTGKVAVKGNISNNGDITTTAGLLELGGSYGGTGIFTEGIGTVTLNGIATTGQTIPSLPYYNLNLAGNNTKTPSANLTITGDLEISSGTTLNAGNYSHTITGDIRNNGTLTTQATTITAGGDMQNSGTITAGNATYTIAGNWNNTGTFNAATSTIALQGNTLQQISGNNTFYNFSFAGTAQAQLQQDITIVNNISVNNSHLNTGANTVWLGPNAALATLETDASHIIGTVQTSRTLAPTVEEDFGKIGLRLTRNNVDPGQVTVERLTGVTTIISDGTESVTRQYNITRTDTTSDITALSMTMDLEFLPNELNSKPLGDYKLYNKGKNQEAFPVPSSIIDQRTMRHTSSNRFGTYTLAPPIMPLPVELMWFKAKRQDQVVVLEWQTASERDNMGFEVQLSADGRTFETLAFVESKSPNSSMVQQYRYVYINPTRRQVAYYRLKQLDYSGKFSYSKIQVVNADNSTFIVQASPNPFKDHIKFAFEAPTVEVTLTDLNGREVLSQNLTLHNRTADGYFRLNTSQVKTSGMYMLTIKTPETVHRTKLLKQ
ncbi:T9SS type A sorting domain-containing protein [Pontibacter populi]|uniref:T9SS type A sorting domain-containing protein n=1 Tax=Pontibacter populi TaxID=890055 RepID=A0ABV1RY98_9BACT